MSSKKQRLSNNLRITSSTTTTHNAESIIKSGCLLNSLHPATHTHSPAYPSYVFLRHAYEKHHWPDSIDTEYGLDIVAFAGGFQKMPSILAIQPIRVAVGRDENQLDHGGTPVFLSAKPQQTYVEDERSSHPSVSGPSFMICTGDVRKLFREKRSTEFGKEELNMGGNRNAKRGNRNISNRT